MPGKVIIYTGAPESKSLNWAPEGLLSSFDPTIANFTGIPKHTTLSTPAPQPTAPNYAEWRSLSLEPTRLHTGFSQQYTTYPPATDHDTQFLNTISFSSTGSQDNNQTLLSQFYETSIAAHNQDIPTSQIIPAIDEDDQEETQFTTTSFNTTAATDSFPSTPKPPLPLNLSAPLPLSDLSTLPSARHITAITPQTITCHLVAGLISLSPPRAVQTRYGTSHLVEVLVGDETRAGFAVTFWLGSSPAASPLAGLRVGDVVLMQNVAMNAFQGRVYGSSLRRGMTKVFLLYRAAAEGEGEGEGGYYDARDLRRGVGGAQVEKTRRVRDWVLEFVGRGAEGREEGRGKRKRRWDVMPDVDETQ
ncbi:hypothetical protein QBC39DRAFT_402443 [Podospora conica]|nr:hypothetical protein QBC39DRAFT_402443 [Schizothecium conicum]